MVKIRLFSTNNNILSEFYSYFLLKNNAFYKISEIFDMKPNISDAIDILRHIVELETIDTFDLIDSDGARVTTLDADATGEAPTWTIVANGDVNMSGSFAEDYIVSSELV